MKVRKQLPHGLVSDARLNYIGHLMGAHHDLYPGFVNIREPFCLLREKSDYHYFHQDDFCFLTLHISVYDEMYLRQLFSNVSTHKNSL